MKRFLVLACAAALTVAASGCRDTTSPGSVLSGTYSLQSVNGSGLPAVVTQGQGFTEEVVSGRITIDRNGTFLDVLTYRDSYYDGSPPTIDEVVLRGYWSLSADQVTFTADDDPYNPYYATVSDGRLYFGNYGSSSWVYTK